MDELKRHEILGTCLAIFISLIAFFVLLLIGFIIWEQFVPSLQFHFGVPEASFYSYIFQLVVGSLFIWMSIGTLLFSRSEWIFHRSDRGIFFTRTHRNILGYKSISFQLNDDSRVSVVRVPKIYSAAFYGIPFYATEVLISNAHKPVWSLVSSSPEAHEKEVAEIKRFLKDFSEKEYKISTGEDKASKQRSAQWLALAGIGLVVTVLLNVPFLTFIFEIIF